MKELTFTCLGILLPFLGTALGAASVFFLHKKRSGSIACLLYGFAAGVMLAALVWSLLIPALERSASPLPAALGLLLGVVFFLLCDGLTARMRPSSQSAKRRRLFFAVTLHNLPEGMAVGVAFASALSGVGLTFGAAFVLTLGIALQNLPEGAIISLPAAAGGKSRTRAFGSGVLSGLVEPVGAVLALLITSLVRVLLPWVLAFAAGAMLYVVCDELVPAVTQDPHKRSGLLALSGGFCLMMLMDVIFS